jgi:hypothetical protein
MAAVVWRMLRRAGRAEDLGPGPGRCRRAVRRPPVPLLRRLEYHRSVEFSRELRADVLSGDITVTFRLWRSSRVKAGGRYRVGPGQIEVVSIELVPFAAIDETDLQRCGEADRESLRRRAAHTGPIQDDTLLYRIEFHVVE